MIKQLTWMYRVSCFLIQEGKKNEFNKNPNRFWRFRPSWMDPKARNSGQLM